MSRSRAPRRRVPGTSEGIDPSRREILERVLLIMVESGCSPHALARAVGAICASLPNPQKQLDPQESGIIEDLPHVMTNWYSDPTYLDDKGGAPRLLRARGPEPSLVGLIRRVYPTTDPERVISLLLRNKAIRRTGSLYEPVSRQVVFKDPQSAATLGLFGLLGHLRAVDNNLHAKNPVVERVAINSRVPSSRREQIYREAGELSQSFLENIDALLHRWEGRPDSAEPLTQFILGSYVCDSALKVRWNVERRSTSTQAARRRQTRRGL